MLVIGCSEECSNAIGWDPGNGVTLSPEGRDFDHGRTNFGTLQTRDWHYGISYLPVYMHPSSCKLA